MQPDDMTSISAERERILEWIQRDKTHIALSPTEVANLDRRLADGWGIRFVEGAESIVELLWGVSDKAAAERYIGAHDRAWAALSSGTACSSLQVEKNLFDTLAHPEILGPVTSQRRHLILDALAVALGLVRTLELKGEFLDVGCHAGFVGSLLSEASGRCVTGVDPSTAAIAFGRSHPACSPKLHLVEAAIPWNTGWGLSSAILSQKAAMSCFSVLSPTWGAPTASTAQ
jgi:hypothetical protein